MANTAAHTAVFDLSKRGTTSKPLSFSLRTSILTIGNAMIMSTISRSRFRLSAGALAVLFFPVSPIGRRWGCAGAGPSFDLGRVPNRAGTLWTMGAPPALGRDLDSCQPAARLAALYGRTLGLHRRLGLVLDRR